MSAFVIVLNRDGRIQAERELDPLLAALDHRGPDGRDTIRLDWIAFGHQHFWTTPEEVGERQPLHDPGAGLHILLDGRLDNREELADGLELERRDLAELSDAALILRAFRRWGEGCLDRFLGPFALAAVDSKARRVICARDGLGDRTLFYYADARILAIASEECALLAHPCVSSRFDEASMARFYAVRTPLPGATFFADIRELPAAHAMAVEGARTRIWRHWTVDSLEEVRLPSDGEYVERFRDVLMESVRCRLRSVAPPAVLMSGGLDSTSIAALAACELRADGLERPLCTVSWVFDELSECDERDYIQPVVEHYALNSILVPSDDTWPLRDVATWPVNPNTPFQNLYRRLISRAYSAAREAGAITVLSGAGGDELYSVERYWLRDLLIHRRVREASKLLFGELVHRGVTSTRSAMGAALGLRRRGGQTPVWLTDHARKHIGEEASISAGPTGRPEQVRKLTGAEAAYGAGHDVSNTSRDGVEMRCPYRDRRLVELVLSLPAYLLYRGGWRKWIMRSAMTSILPDPVRLRWQGTSLTPLSVRGLVEKEAEAVRHILDLKNSIWPRFVRPEWMRCFAAQAIRDGRTEALVPWHSICMELWINRGARANLDLVKQSGYPEKRGF